MDEINKENPQNIDSAPDVVAPEHILAQSQSNWPDWRVELLKTLWASGMTSTQIGIELGLSRNQVVGKKWRLGLTRKTPEPEAKRTARLARRRDRERERRAAKKAHPPTPVEEIIALADKEHPEIIKSLGVDIEQLKWEGSHPTNCRAIITSDQQRPTLYCGLEVARGESWCLGHCRRFIARYNPTQPRIQTAMAVVRSALIT